MSLQERGAYIDLLCHAWMDAGIPDDDAEIARLLQISARTWRKVGGRVKPMFQIVRDGKLRNTRQEEERTKQQLWREKSARGGRQSPKQTPTTQQAEHNDPSALVVTKREPNNNTAVCSSPSAFASTVRTPLPPPQLTELEERARRFLKRYEVLHRAHRHGAYYLPKPSLDFGAAQEICQLWTDDAHLERMVVAWLTHEDSRDQFLRGPRTVGKFKSRASGYDDQLRAETDDGGAF
jgi:uncharacterized protein YdaU (DUF1376 family)